MVHTRREGEDEKMGRHLSHLLDCSLPWGLHFSSYIIFGWGIKVPHFCQIYKYGIMAEIVKFNARQI